MVIMTSSMTSSLEPLIPGICRLTSMLAPLVPSSYSSLCRGWTFRTICLQNHELTPETCTPKSVNVITFCPSTMMGVSLDCPTRQVIGSGFRKRMAGVTSHLPLYLAVFIFAGPGLGSGWECRGLIIAFSGCYQLRGGLHSLGSPWLV